MDKDNQEDLNNNPFTNKPKSMIRTGNFLIRNFGDPYFFPHKKLQNGLKEVIIFTENQQKRGIPNGSVWVYQANTPYIPEILREDVGCGITGYLLPQLSGWEFLAKEILKIISQEKIRIGRGNHFIDFTGSHPLNPFCSMILLHSDFNFNNDFPADLRRAQELTQNAKSKRRETIEKILDKLGIAGEFHKDWTHNSVEQTEDSVIYRKGAINLKETNREGLLALNPFDGVFFYSAEYKDYYHSMQHGTGRKDAKKFQGTGMTTFRENRVKVYLRIPGESPEELYQHYNTEDKFTETLFFGRVSMGYSLPFIVICTD